REDHAMSRFGRSTMAVVAALGLGSEAFGATLTTGTVRVDADVIVVCTALNAGTSTPDGFSGELLGARPAAPVASSVGVRRIETPTTGPFCRLRRRGTCQRKLLSITRNPRAIRPPESNLKRLSGSSSSRIRRSSALLPMHRGPPGRRRPATVL